MGGRRCRALSCWALALISFASFAILYTDPWEPRHQPEDIDGKSQQGNIDQEAFLENSGTLKHLGRNLDYNDELVDDIADDDDHDLDYDVEGEGGLEEEAEKRKKAKNAKETAEEKKARRLRRLAEDQAEYRQWVRRRREEKRRRGGKGRNGGKENKKGGRKELKTDEKKLQPREFELWKDLLSLDEDDD